MANKHIKRSSISLVIWKMQTKIIMRYKFIPIRLIKFQKSDISMVGSNVNSDTLLVGV